MKYLQRFWLVPFVVHVAEQPYWKMHAIEWIIPTGDLPEPVAEGDVLYLANQEVGIYAWGRLSEKEPQSIRIARGAICNRLVSPDQFANNENIRGLLNFPQGQFNFLTTIQIRSINALMSTVRPKPPEPYYLQFILGKKLVQDEDITTEYKEVRPNQILREVYTAALSFLRQEGGSVYFGIKDSDHSVVGLQVSASERDRIKRDVESKLATINPRIEPVTNYSMEFHPVLDSSGQIVRDRYVFEVEIKPSEQKDHESAGGKVYVKTFSGKQRAK
jgi:hypothetical protein